MRAFFASILPALIAIAAAIALCVLVPRMRAAQAELRNVRVAQVTEISRGGRAPGSSPTTPPPRSSRFDEILKAAPRGPGATPLVFTEELFSEIPELRNSYLQAAVAHRRLRFQQFLDTSNLTPGEKERFIAILAEREQDWVKHCVLASENGYARTDARFTTADAAATQRQEADLRSLLGAEKFEALKAYRRSSSARQGKLSAKAVVKASFYSGETLSFENFERVATILTESEALSGQSKSDLAPVRAMTATHLTSSQQEVLDLVLDYWALSRSP